LAVRGVLGGVVQGAVIISMITAFFAATPPHQAAATTLGSKMVVYNTDYASFGVGGMRGNGAGTIAVSGVSGKVTKALLYWAGPTNSTDPTVNATVTFAGSSITGTNIGFSYDNSWGFTNSQAYRADVTSLVSAGPTSYALSNFRKANAEINGASLLVFFDDGDASNNRDIVVVDGNDSNGPNGPSTFDPAGWSASVSGVKYSAGAAKLEFHVSDGQAGSVAFNDAPVIYNGDTASPIASPDANGEIFRGDSVPNGVGTCDPFACNGGLWDIKSFDISSWLASGSNDITITTDYLQDFLSLVALVVNIPANDADLSASIGAAPATVAPGGTVSVTPTVTNLGPDPAGNTFMYVTLPTALVVTANSANCSPPVQLFSLDALVLPTQTWQCAAGSLAVGASASGTLQVTAPTSPGTLPVTNTVVSDATDAKPNNDVAGTTIVAGIASCDETLLPGAQVTMFSGTAVVASTTANTDGAFVFVGLAPGAYTVAFTLGYTTCGGPFTVGDGGTISGSSPIDLHNHAWPVAYRIDPLATPGIAVTQQEHLYRQGQSAWFKFKVQPGGKVIVTLTGLPANYDLTLYKDVSAYAAALSTPKALVQAGADFAPDAFSPDAFSPDAFSPDAFSPDAFSPDAFSPDAFSPDAFSPDAFSPDAYSPDAFSPDAFSPDAFSPDAFSPDAFSAEGITPDAYSGAQTKALIAVSAFNGTSSEGIIRNTWENDQDFYVRVRGRNGAFSLAAPFTLNVIEATGSCTAVSPILTASTTTATAGNYKTVILTDRTRPPFAGASASELSALDARLATYAARPEVAGVIVNVGADAKVIAANAQADPSPSCPYGKNQVAYAVKEIVSKYWALNPLQYVVLVGNDQAIPSFRQPDEAGLANERTFYPPVLDASPSQANLRLGYILGQDRYGSRTEVSYGDHSFPVPELAVGRLVEKPAEITSVLDAYLLTSGGVTPVTTPSLVTGYDFMADAATAIRSELELGTGRTADALIEPGNLPPTDPSAWTAGQLRALYLNTRHDVSFFGAHFSPATMLAADYTTRFLASELAASTLDLRNAIIFSIGCHAGFNEVDSADVPGVTREPDFAQAASIKGMALIANQGYGYGDTDTIQYDERLNLLFSQELRRGTGAVSIGQALVRAKAAYLASTPQLRAIDEKTIVEKTLFGVPQLSVNMPGTRLAAASNTSIVSSAGLVATNPGAGLQLRTADASITPSLTLKTVALKNTSDNSTTTATYATGSSGTVVEPAEPVLPLETRNVTLASPAGTVLRGVGFRGGSFTDLPNIVPLTGAPATELRGIHSPFVSNVLYPVQFWRVNYLDALRDGGQTRLNVTPAQYVSNPAGSTSGTLREFTGPQSFRLFYSGWTGASADASAPSILRVSAVPSGGNVTFAMNVAGLPAAGIQGVWVTYTATSGPFAGKWQSLDLNQDSASSTLWTGQLALGTTAPGDVRFMVQAVNGVGLVTLATNQGAYYVPGPDTVLPALPKQPTSVTFSGTPPTTGTYREQATFTAQLTSGTGPLAGRILTFGVGSERRQVITDANGMATASIALLQTPGVYDVRASFDETSDLLGSSTAPLSFTITKRATALSITPACTPLVATLRDTSSGARTLRDQSVVFQATTGGQTFWSYDITDFAGRARLTNGLADGTYSVTASFGGTIDLGGGVTASQTNDRYLGSSAITTLAVNPADTTVTNTSGTLVQLGSALTASATITSSRSLTGAVVCYVVRDVLADVAVASGPVTVTPGGGSSTVTITGLPTGVYSITATVVGGDAANVFSKASAPTLVAVYDASSGFVTGGGTISSPLGAYTPAPSLSGPANFGFVSKYQKGVTVPVGNTQFDFQLANLMFKSTSYQWLVVSGARAQYKGSGTLNGTPGYGFLLTAIDGQVNGGGGTDKFRIKIWDANSVIVYDNQMNAPDDSDPTTIITSGSIVLHK
jgi:hypothetical protein